MVDRSDEFRGLDRVALDDEAHPGPDLQGPCRHRRRRQGDERVHHVIILLAELAASGRRRFAGAGDVRVLGRPDRLEAALFERPAELGRRHRIIGEEHRRAKIHLSLHRSECPSLTSIHLPVSLQGRGRPRRAAGAYLPGLLPAARLTLLGELGRRAG